MTRAVGWARWIACVGVAATVIRGRDHCDGGAAELTPAKDAQLRAQGVGHVDQDEGRPECAAGAVQMKLDGPVSASVRGQERGRRLRRRVIVEPARDEHDAALEELLLQPVPEAHALRVQLRSQRIPADLVALLDFPPAILAGVPMRLIGLAVVVSTGAGLFLLASVSSSVGADARHPSRSCWARSLSRKSSACPTPQRPRRRAAASQARSG